jgi:hypothetical protein
MNEDDSALTCLAFTRSGAHAQTPTHSDSSGIPRGESYGGEVT